MANHHMIHGHQSKFIKWSSLNGMGVPTSLHTFSTMVIVLQ